MPSIRTFAAPLLLLVPLLAQGSVEQVVPGRSFRSQKLLTPGVTDSWLLDVEVDEVLFCIVDSDAFDPVLELVDDQGRVLAKNDGAGTRSEVRARATTKGAYKFRVSPFQGSGGGAYSYTLHRCRTEPLGAAGEASHVFGKEQWWHYRIALKRHDVLVPTVLGDGRLTAVQDDAGNELGALHGGYRATNDGDYLVRIEGSEGHRCQTLTQLARAGERALDVRCEERIAPYGLDTWHVRLPAGECIVVDLRMPEAVIGLDIREAGATDQGPAFVATGNFDKGGVRRLLFFVRRAATLEVHLRHQGSSAATYELAVRRWGNTARTGERIDARLLLGDGALFHLPLQAGEMVEVLAHSEQFDASLDVWDPDGNVIANADDRSLVDRDAFHRWLVARPGTYRVLVHCRGGIGSGAFTLRADSQPLPRLNAGQSATVQGGSHLHLDLQVGECVWLSLRSATFDAALQVVDPVGDARFVAEGGGIGGDVLVAYRASHAGRHTLIVHARSGAGDGELLVVRP